MLLGCGGRGAARPALEAARPALPYGRRGATFKTTTNSTYDITNNKQLL